MKEAESYDSVHIPVSSPTHEEIYPALQEVEAEEAIQAKIEPNYDSSDDSSDGCPIKGQHVDIVEDVRRWYERYGRRQGFSTKMHNSIKRSRSDDIGRVHFKFSKKNLGKNSETSERDGNKISSDKCGCKTTMNINWNTKIGKYVVISFTDIHKSKLASPRNHHRMKVYRFPPEAAKNLTATFKLHNILVSKVPTLFLDKTFNKRDCYNHNAKLNKKRLVRGVAQAALEWVRKKQNEYMMFYFDIELNEEDRTLNLFF
ncbi:hypothetical protein GIB67_023709 [Kingdonia uniflora]|uniref:FAR1 domain-containing protein n=1 Tax=Kingdonia uniflora TaxID=39325 RepID=A0A7J7MGI1_9MAGN|nr:hypothetical protein GIB67_023709 [Kingdonia uniflora]